MLRAICGVARPYRGKITVLGRRLKDWKRAELFRGGVAMLPQDPLNLMVKKTVRGDLEEMLDGRGLTAGQRTAAVREVAALTDIVPLLDAHPFDLSGGEVQRAALAKVLLNEPRLLLLDEPTKGLDAFFKEKLAALLRSLTARGTTVLMVSHDIEFCASYADRCALFFDGDAVTTNPPRRFFASNSFYTTAANRISRGSSKTPSPWKRWWSCAKADRRRASLPPLAPSHDGEGASRAPLSPLARVVAPAPKRC